MDNSPLWWIPFPIMLKKKYINNQDLENILITIY